MENKQRYYKYSEYLTRKYNDKVYKLPINLPLTCPNRLDAKGCIFCAEVGTGFEALPAETLVVDQLKQTQTFIAKKYHARKYIAYFQNYTNTFLPLKQFKVYMEQAAAFPDIVQISISTRPDCINSEYLDILKQIEANYHCDINIELGLQTVNYHTLHTIRRGHGLAEFIDAVLQIRSYGFSLCTHVILNLPDDELVDAIETAKVLSALKIDVVKIHSLYIAKDTILCDQYESGKIAICDKMEYLERLICFLEHLDPDIAVERLFSRIPEKDSVFSNWGTSWWKLLDEAMALMEERESFQGKRFDYLNGSALRKL